MERLQTALDAKSEFVNTMSHELRSPLSVIIGYADILGDGGLDTNFVAGRIRDSALDLLQLVDNSLTVARLGTGKLKVNLEEFSFNSVAADVSEALRALPEGRKEIPVVWNIDPALPRVELDRLKVKQILQNLVSNGLKYTDAGIVTVTVGRQGEQLWIEVRDTGRGIPQEAQSRIFEMFERVEAIGDNPPAGVGLGLYIVKNLVDLMNGTIQLVSREGEGSSFTVRLPVRLTAARAEASEDPTKQLNPRAPNIGYAS
jgi:signal transduction histidine kinase